MKSLTLKFTALACGFCLLSTGCKPDNSEPALVNPSLEILTGDITVQPSGQACTVEYILKDPVDGGEIFAECQADWITDVDWATEGTVTFTVQPNDTENDRSVDLVIVYVYGDGEELRDSVGISQPLNAPEYDYEFAAQLLTGVYYGTKNGLNGEYSYYVTFSDMPYSEDGYGQPGGTYYVFDLFGPAPENEDDLMFPAGTYTLGEQDATAEFTFTPELSGAFTVGPTGQMDVMYAIFVEGTLELSLDSEGNWVMTADLLDTDEKTHHVEYVGDAGTWRDDSLPPYGTIDEDVNFTAISVSGEFIKAAGQETMYVALSFSDKPFGTDGDVPVSSNVLVVKGWVPFDVSGNVGTGDYEISNEQGANYSLQYGMFFGDVPDGTYVAYYDESGYPSYALITSGTLFLHNWSGYYEITWDFTTDTGHSVTGSYAGALTVDMPKEFSTLESDITLDLSNAEATGTYLGDWYVNGGGTWKLKLGPAYNSTEGDGVQIEINAEKLGFDVGIPSGVYTAGADGYPYPAYPEIGQYRRGFLENGLHSGTCYMGGFNNVGQPSELAPATEGDLEIKANEDGTYTLKFSFLDDKGHTWDGEWTGHIALSSLPWA